MGRDNSRHQGDCISMKKLANEEYSGFASSVRGRDGSGLCV